MFVRRAAVRYMIIITMISIIVHLGTYHQVGNAVPPYLAYQLAEVVKRLLVG